MSQKMETLYMCVLAISPLYNLDWGVVWDFWKVGSLPRWNLLLYFYVQSSIWPSMGLAWPTWIGSI